MDLRKLMLPYTALKLKEKKRNNLKDFLNVAGPMGVTHSSFYLKSKLRLSLGLQRPLKALLSITPSLPAGSFQESPLIVLSGFAAADEQLRLTTMVFKNIFPDIDINTVKLSSCQRIVLLNYNKNVSSLHVYSTVWLVFIFKLLNASI
ncbi:peter Pan-like protein [Gossypium hirsutum]|uniref:Peter Pan-like protein n=1 Tax=Gossypium hirsutum TaxID=3635 RepID=A0ABM2ZWY1_GOSHI|nr:peter Pan-like protein [Gossypium hirsutum]